MKPLATGLDTWTVGQLDMGTLGQLVAIGSQKCLSRMQNALRTSCSSSGLLLANLASHLIEETVSFRPLWLSLHDKLIWLLFDGDGAADGSSARPIGCLCLPA
ncbi:hypothetical protein M5D96_005211, partial [Drosophila gunungcola]